MCNTLKGLLKAYWLNIRCFQSLKGPETERNSCGILTPSQVNSPSYFQVTHLYHLRCNTPERTERGDTGRRREREDTENQLILCPSSLPLDVHLYTPIIPETSALSTLYMAIKWFQNTNLLLPKLDSSFHDIIKAVLELRTARDIRFQRVDQTVGEFFHGGCQLCFIFNVG